MNVKHTLNAQEKDVYLYVAEDATYATGNQAIFKASDFVGATAVNSAENQTIFRFWPQDKTKMAQSAGDPAYDTFTLTHTANAHVEIMKTVAGAMANPHGGFVVIQDDLGTAFGDGSTTGEARTDLKYPPIASTGTAVAVTAVAITTVDA